MKAYTDLKQSKKLAEFLPIESADMRYHTVSHYNPYPCNEIVYTIEFSKASGIDIPCWSLTALLECLPTATLDISDGPDKQFRLHCEGHFSEWRNNPVDVCYETIIKLHKNNSL